MHTFLKQSKRELAEIHGIHLSTAEVRKILTTGRQWSTNRSQKVAKLYNKYSLISQAAKTLGVSRPLVTIYLPYKKMVYDLEEKVLERGERVVEK